jgi:hypothetical protein
MVMQSSTLPSLRSSFSATCARFSIAVIASRSARQVSASSNSGIHHASTVSMWGCSFSASADSFHIFSKAGLNSSTRPLLPNTATASARLSSVSCWTRVNRS